MHEPLAVLASGRHIGQLGAMNDDQVDPIERTPG
jgi:hypothetical protein